jgi:hypothetical protein
MYQIKTEKIKLDPEIGAFKDDLEFYIVLWETRDTGLFEVILSTHNSNKECDIILFMEELDLKTITPADFNVPALSLFENKEGEGISETFARLVFDKVEPSLKICRESHDPSDKTLVLSLEIGGFVCESDIDNQSIAFIFK